MERNIRGGVRRSKKDVFGGCIGQEESQPLKGSPWGGGSPSDQKRKLKGKSPVAQKLSPRKKEGCV